MKYLFLLVALLFGVWSIPPTRAQAPPPSAQRWACAPCGKACDALNYAEPGTCPHCAMALVPRKAAFVQSQTSEGIPEVTEPTLWPLFLEMRVPFAPTAFPSSGKTHLFYELYLTNFGPTSLLVHRVEVLDAKGASSSPLATFGAPQLEAMWQLVGNPPDVDPAQRLRLAPGQSAIVFMAIGVAGTIPLPDRLLHRVHTAHAVVEGASIGTHQLKLRMLSPPVDGADWLAADGPGNSPNNHHRRGVLLFGGQTVNSRRLATDWKQVRAGRSFSGDARDVHAYYCYEKVVRAVTNGRVVATRDGLPDNVPGPGAQVCPAVPLTLETVAGNRITVALGGGQFAHYLHLQPGSVRVKVGQRVRRGQVLGRVGNSGDAREPHLHFEVTTSPILLRGEGVPYLLDHYRTRPAPQGPRVQQRQQLPLDQMMVDFHPGKD